MILRFSLGAGTTYLSSAGSWGSTAYFGVTGQTNVVATNGATLYITGVQLEVGTQATGFEYRQYGQELALCQRYYYKLQGSSSAQFSNGFVDTTTSALALIPLPTTMRIAPTSLDQSGTATDYAVRCGSPTGTIVCSVVPTISTTSVNSALISLTVASGLTAGQSFGFRAQTSNSYIGLSAEL